MLTKRPFILVFFTLLLAYSGPSYAQEKTQTIVETSTARLVGKSAEVRSVAPRSKTLRSPKDKFREIYPKDVPNFYGTGPIPSRNRDKALPKNGDPIRNVLPKNGDPLELEEELNFPGLNSAQTNSGVPDINGAVSYDHYIQLSNASPGTLMWIFDKNGNALSEPIDLNALWQPLGITGLGDGVMLWDRAVNRWVLTELGTFGSNIMLVAISVTDDPFGSWYLYEFQAPALPDYPKYAIGNNAYFITTNEGQEDQIPIYALDRAAMLRGESEASVQRILRVPKFNEDVPAFQVLAPVRKVGTSPNEGEAQYFVRIHDDSWDGGQDNVELWRAEVNWDDPDATEVIGPLRFFTAPFESELCPGGNIFQCVQQSDGTPISVLEHVSMNFPVLRVFPDHESIVMNFSVDVSGLNQAGVRWVELRKGGDGNWALHRESTIAPDENSRFMGTTNIDSRGNILAGYAITGPNQPLALRMSGALATDEGNEMSIVEKEVAAGSGVYELSRWGDYFSMSVDPSDETTFWLTGEYVTGAESWGTQIIKVKVHRDTNDLAIHTLLGPKTAGMSDEEQMVSVRLRNTGMNAIDSFSIAYQLEDGPWVEEAYKGILMPGETIDHVFQSTVNFPQVRDYNFRVAIHEMRDENPSNDSLNVVVTRLLRRDLQVVEALGIERLQCDSDFMTEIVVRNGGLDTVKEFTLNYQVNDNALQSVEWDGELPPFQTTSIDIVSTDFLQGENELLAYSQLPVTIADEAPVNDTLRSSFTADSTLSRLIVEITSDAFPGETTWELTTFDGEVLASGGPFEEIFAINEDLLCLNSGCYFFHIFDSFGDGGPRYEITDEEGNELASTVATNFGFEERNWFCLDSAVCTVNFFTTTAPETASNTQDGSIMINVDGGLPPFQYSIDGGATLQNDPLFTGLRSGEYQIFIIDANNCLGTGTAEVPRCIVQFRIDVTDASSSTSSDGGISVDVVRGVRPLEYSIDGGITYQSDSTFNDLPPGPYDVTVRDAIGCVRTIGATVSFTSSTQDIFSDAIVRVFPNPVTDYFDIEIHGLEDVDRLWIQILDGQGRKVRHNRLIAYNNVLKNRVSMYGLASGPYYLQLYAKDKISRLVKVIVE